MGKDPRHTRLKVTTKAPTWFALANWPAAWGAALIFLSFIAQNALLPVYVDEARRLERSQLAISLEQARRDMWHSVYLTEKAQKPLSSAGAVALVSFLEANKTILAWSFGRTSDDAGAYEGKLQSRERTVQQARVLLASGKLEELEALALASGIETAVVLPEDDQRFFDAITSARRGEKMWNIIFLITYTAGALLVGGDALIQRRKAKKASHPMPNSEGSPA